MSNYRKVSLDLTPSTVAQVQTWINNIRAALPNLISLTPAAKLRLCKMGRKRYAWCQSAFEYAQLFPEVLPENRNFVRFSQVRNDYEALGLIVKNLSLLHNALGDTYMQLGANYYTHGRDVYDAVNDPSNDEEPGILLVRDELSTQFAGQGRSAVPADMIDETITSSQGIGAGEGNATENDTVAVGGTVID